MSKSVLIALIIAVLAVFWVLSGVVGNDTSAGDAEITPISQAPDDDSLSAQDKIQDVRVEDKRAEQMDDTIEITGRTQASRKVIIRAETMGQVKDIMVTKGARVTAGQILAKLDVQGRAAQLSQAQQLLSQRQIQYNAAKELAEKGFNSRVRLAEARAQLESARAQVKQAAVELSNINVKAPFDGVINDQMVELGDYVSSGTEMFDVVDLSPIEVSGFLTEKQMEYIEEGTQANATLLKGMEAQGEITFIASAADPQTRTFKMEMTLPNEDYKIREGLTAKIQIQTKEAQAYKISPSILSLTDEGTVGVKIVNAQNRVEFMPIALLKDTPEYLWVGGLPSAVRLITVGQEFVIEGQEVRPVYADGTVAEGLPSQGDSVTP